MSHLQNLRPNKGSTHSKKRVGRGAGSGWGQTSGRGHKGQNARSGGGTPVGFEGGQMPLWRRLPKFGFTNIFKKEFDLVNLDQLDKFSGEVNPQILKEARLSHRGKMVKILGRGKVTKALTVKAHKFSDTAKKAIEDAGGQTEVIK